MTTLKRSRYVLSLFTVLTQHDYGIILVKINKIKTPYVQQPAEMFSHPITLIIFIIIIIIII